MRFCEGRYSFLVIARSSFFLVFARSEATKQSTRRTLNRRDGCGLGKMDRHGLTPSRLLVKDVV